MHVTTLRTRYATPCLMLLAAALVISASVGVAAENSAIDRDAVERITAGIAARQSHYPGLSFAYDVTVFGSLPSPGAGYASDVIPINAQEIKFVFSLMPSKSVADSSPWRLWRRHVQSKTGEWRLDQFASWDGELTRVFIRDEVVDEGRWSLGLINPAFNSGDFQCNNFDNILFLDLTGLNQSIFATYTEIPDLRAGREYRVVGKKNGADGTPVLELETRIDSFDVMHLIEVTEEPDFMVLRWEAVPTEGGAPYETYEITTIDRIDGVAYPASGRHSVRAYGKKSGYDYQFTVTEVKRIGDDARAEWAFNDWPPGTIVSNMADNAGFEVPHDKQQLLDAMLRKKFNIAKSPIVLRGGPWSWPGVVAIITLPLVAVALLFALLRRRRRAA